MTSASHARRTLVMGPSWVGDMVMAQALFKTIAENSPGPVEIDVVGPPWSLPVVGRMAEVSAVHELPVPHGSLGLGTQRRLARRLRDNGYSNAIVLPAKLKAALVPFLARVPVRTGFLGEHRYGLINDVRELDKDVLVSTAERYCALGVAPGAALPPRVPFPLLTIDTDSQRTLVASLRLELDRPVVALCPGAAFGSSKRWPVESFAEVARALLAQGRAVWVMGSRGEAELGAAISKSAPGVVDLCGRTQLVDAVDLLSLATATITNDSGLLHIAAAVGSRVVGIYGSTPPSFAPPLTDNRAVHYRDLSCSPCFERECPLDHHNCMREITPDEVLATVGGV